MSLRADRFVSVRLIHSTIRALPRRSESRIPVLMYHSISRERDSRRSSYYRTVTSPETFKRHLDVLRSERFDVITLSQAVAAFSGGAVIEPGRNAVVITFDDGLRDFYTDAFPLLQDAGFPSTVFLTTGYIDRDFITGSPCLRSVEVEELARYGVEFGSHTVSHPRLLNLSADELDLEFSESRQRIEELIGAPVGLFSYPFRFPLENIAFRRTVRERLAAHGYTAGVTTSIGRAGMGDDVFFMPRLPVNDCDDDALLAAKLYGAYDWVGSLQASLKFSRGMCERIRTWMGGS